jgi:hypothetical protein
VVREPIASTWRLLRSRWRVRSQQRSRWRGRRHKQLNDCSRWSQHWRVRSRHGGRWRRQSVLRCMLRSH